MSERRILFVDRTAPGDTVLMAFDDPCPCYAILSEAPDRNAADALHVVLPPLSDTPQPSTHNPDASVVVKLRNIELLWRPGHATLQCAPEQTEQLLAAIIEFAYYERELRRLEAEIAAAWPELEQDRSLPFEVTPTDLQRSAIVGSRMGQTLDRRISHARIEPHLYEPGAVLSVTARKLGEELREKARTEARMETVDGQLEVFEYIYEMASQRMGEFRGSSHEHRLEWIIIALLAAETLLVLAGMLFKFKS